jgi:hypothetical protein
MANADGGLQQGQGGLARWRLECLRRKFSFIVNLWHLQVGRFGGLCLKIRDDVHHNSLQETVAFTKSSLA